MDSHVMAIIVNPRAGNGRALALLPHLAVVMRELGLPRQIHLTTERGEATAMAQALAEQGARVVVAVGGDGTINEVANGLIASGRPAALGIIPAGRGNDFVRSTGTPRDPAQALTRFASGETRRVDTGRATFGDGTSHLFLNHAGLGLDAQIARRAADSRLHGKTLPYLGAVAGALLCHRNLPMTIEVDDSSIEQPVCFLIAANGASLAGGMKLAPDAAIDDGRLDIVLVGDISRPGLLRQIPLVYRGAHLGHPDLTLVQARRVRVEAPEPVPVELDGECLGSSPVTLTIEPGALLLASAE